MSDILELKPAAPTALRSRLAAFVELTKVRILAMVLAATAVGFFLAAPEAIAAAAGATLLSTLLGTALSVGGANALNQYIELEQDRKMARTRRRPLPSGRLSDNDVLAFGILCCVVGVLWLTLQVNPLSGLLSAFAAVSYVLVYTPLKRSTPVCVAVGAVPGAIPPMIGWAAGSGTLGLGAWLLFAILFFWQIAHFATIAWQYRQDYARAGFAIGTGTDPFGIWADLHLMTQTLCLIVVSLLPAIYGLAGTIYAVGAVVLGAAFLGCGVFFAVSKTTGTARLHLRASVVYLTALLVLMMVDKV